MLQWGHDFAAVEIAEAAAAASLLEGLQWGHDFAAVEMLYSGRRIDMYFLPLQWGHDFAAVEMW